MKRLTTICFLLGALTSTAYSQGKTLHQKIYWIRYFNQIYFNERLSWINEVDNRRFINPDVQNQLIAHTHLHYLIKNFEPAVGCSFSWIYAQIPEDGYKVVTPEIRPFQELTYHIPLTKKLKFQERVRVDERYIRQVNKAKTELEDGYNFNFRFRFRSQLSYKLNDKYIFKASDEVMYNDRANTFDQNRIYAATEFVLSKKISVEVGYLHIVQKRASNKGYYSRDIGRLTLYHKIFLKKKE